jgi:DNA-directed RNA polymerase beta' subunit
MMLSRPLPFHNFLDDFNRSPLWDLVQGPYYLTSEREKERENDSMTDGEKEKQNYQTKMQNIEKNMQKMGLFNTSSVDKQEIDKQSDREADREADIDREDPVHFSPKKQLQEECLRRIAELDLFDREERDVFDRTLLMVSTRNSVRMAKPF